MDKAAIQLQVFFEEPFWIGICERVTEDRLSVCKVTFGPEPKDYEIEDYILRNWFNLKFSRSTEAELKQKDHVNPKRMQREIKKQVECIGIGTKSQQALKLQHEENKLIQKSRSREQKEEESERLFALKQQRKKDKHKGR